MWEPNPLANFNFNKQRLKLVENLSVFHCLIEEESMRMKNESIFQTVKKHCSYSEIKATAWVCKKGYERYIIYSMQLCPLSM